MNSSYHSSVTDEMLSAYIDGVATAQERALIEAALVESNDVVWRLESMQHTVALLKQLPELQPPHSFALTESMAGTASASAYVSSKAAKAAEGSAGLWQTIQRFFQVGNPLMRNFAAASFAAFLVLAGLGILMTEPAMLESSVTVLPANSAMVADAPHAETEQPPTEVALLAANAEPDTVTTAEGAPAAAAPIMAAEAGSTEVQPADGAAAGQVGAAAAPMAAPVTDSVTEADQAAPVIADEIVEDEAIPEAAAALAQSEAPVAAAARAAEPAPPPDPTSTTVNEENAGQPPAETIAEDRSALWYLAYISLALAGLFTVLWLISRRDYAPAI